MHVIYFHSHSALMLLKGVCEFPIEEHDIYFLVILRVWLLIKEQKKIWEQETEQLEKEGKLSVWCRYVFTKNMTST